MVSRVLRAAGAPVAWSLMSETVMNPQIQPFLLVGGALLGLVLVVVLAVVVTRTRRERRELHERFGPEFERTVLATGSKRAAVRDLREREALHTDLELRDLNDADRELVRRRMAALQFRFVDDPADVMLSAGRVATEVLRAQGYPVGEDRDAGLRLFSVDHPAQAVDLRTVVEGDYDDDVDLMRAAFLGLRRALAEALGITYDAADAGLATTTDLRVEQRLERLNDG